MVWGTTKNSSVYLGWQQMPIAEDKSDAYSIVSSDFLVLGAATSPHILQRSSISADLAITSTYPKIILKRLGGGKVHQFWAMQYSWTNSTSSLHIPFGEGWDHVTTSASQNQGNHLSNSAVPEKRGIMGGIMSLLERCVEVLTLSTSECDLIWVNICRCN